MVFFGTPEFAVPSLQALVASGEHVVGVVTQPDRPAGRGQKPSPPPVKRVALALGLPVVQPEKVRGNPELLATLRGWQPDVIVVVAYGKILPREILQLPSHGCINVHASLLPRYRGAAPIQWALLRGERETGVSIMLMNEEMDAGPVLLQERVTIGPEETYGELRERLAHLGAQCLLQALAAWHAGTVVPQVQNAAAVTLAPAVDKAQAAISWQESAEDVCRKVRAFHPTPGAYFLWHGKRVKVHRARVAAVGNAELPPGTVVAVEPQLVVRCAQGAVELVEVQLEGRRKALGVEFARGARWHVGQRLA